MRASAVEAKDELDLVVMVGYYQLLGSFNECAVLGIEVEKSVAHVPFNG